MANLIIYATVKKKYEMILTKIICLCALERRAYA